jgi:hypothetical protein
MSFREPLPQNCPPAESQEILEERVVFRLVNSSPAKLDDFQSLRALRPEAVFPFPECVARGLSVHADLTDSEKTRKLPRFKNALICRVQLTNGAGQIQQTFRPTHHTWWPLAAFDILNHCEVLT